MVLIYYDEDFLLNRFSCLTEPLFLASFGKFNPVFVPIDSHVKRRVFCLFYSSLSPLISIHFGAADAVVVFCLSFYVIIYPPLRCFVWGVLISIVISIGYNMHALLASVDPQTGIIVTVSTHTKFRWMRIQQQQQKTNKRTGETIVDAFSVAA